MSSKPIRRLPHPPTTKAKISASLVGRVVSEATREKLSKALKGIPKSEDAKRAIANARRRRPRWSAVDACKMEAKRRFRDFDTRRIKQWKRDKYLAARANKMDLWHDLDQSGGWKSKRKMFDPLVSDGAEKDGARKRKV